MTSVNGWKMNSAALLLLSALSAICGHAQTFTTLLNFDGTDGAYPAFMSLVQGPDGDLYGTTESGGNCASCGTVFRVSETGMLSSHDFCKPLGCIDGSGPSGGLTLTTNGNFYGTTQSGGSHSTMGGTVFEITLGGKLTTLYSFCAQENCSDGEWPLAGVIEGIDGNLYGTTIGPGVGTVFKLGLDGMLATLYRFGLYDGAQPRALTQGSDGNLYGTTFAGGTNSCSGGNTCGTVFTITTNGKLTNLHNFDGNDGAGPVAIIQGTDGNFYGTTSEGGTSNACNNGGLGCGTVFRMTPGGMLATLYSFCTQPDCTDGFSPPAGLIQGVDGNFYGTTSGGGNPTCPPYGGCGTVFEITSEGSFTALHALGSADGLGPEGGLLEATNGIFYGTTAAGGNLNCAPPDGCGTIFSLTTDLAPFVSFVRPYGKVGQTGGILGQGFTGTTSVMLNGVPATFTVVSDTFIKATVPVGATTGYVTVATPTGVLTSNVPFRVIP